MRKLKVLLTSVLTAAMLMTSTVFGLAADSLSVSGVYGDVDNDGKTTSADSLSVLRNSVNLEIFSETQKAIADVDKDGKITSSDALSILRYSVGLSPESKDNSNTASTNTTSHSSNTTSTNTTSHSSNTSSTDTSSRSSSTTSTVSRTEQNTTSVVSEPQRNDDGHGDYMFVLNTSTKKYHTTHCRAVDKISSGNRRIYYVEVPGGTAEDKRYIESEGYVLCKYCEKK